MYNFVICGIFKNEAHILDEWITHYLFHGVDHIYLVNDFSTDNYMPVIEKHKDKVTLFHNDIVTKEYGRQVMINKKYFEPLLKMSKWMAILDLDEFLYSPDDVNIYNILEKYSSYSQLIVYWLYFGSNGYIEQPSTVVKYFTKRGHFDETHNWSTCYKSIFQCRRVVSLHIHLHEVIKKTKYLLYSEQKIPKLIINHYNVQSKRFYLEIKQTRGDCDNYLDLKNLTRNEEMFKKFDLNDVEDMRLYEQNKTLF